MPDHFHIIPWQAKGFTFSFPRITYILTCKFNYKTNFFYGRNCIALISTNKKTFLKIPAPVDDKEGTVIWKYYNNNVKGGNIFLKTTFEIHFEWKGCKIC